MDETAKIELNPVIRVFCFFSFVSPPILCRCHFSNVHQLVEYEGTDVALGLLVEAFQYVAYDAADAFRRCQRTLTVYVAHLLLLDVLLLAHVSINL